MEKTRESNFELLRILATLAIIIYHNNGGYIRWMDGGIDDWFYGGTSMAILRTTIQSMTHIAVDVFVLISGYFSIKPKGKSILNLFTLLGFSYLICYLFNCYVIGESPLIHPRAFLYNILPFSRENWFIQAYLFLVLLSPLVNSYIDKASEKQLAFYTAVFILCGFYFGCLWRSTYFDFNGGLSVATLLLVYIVGRYLRLYGIEKVRDIKTVVIISVWLLCTLIMVIVELYLPSKVIYICSCSPIKILSASCVLVIFSRIKIQSNVINWLSSSCLAVFIFHVVNPIDKWSSHFDISLLKMQNSFIYFSGIMAIAISCFVIGTMIDKVRILLCKPIFAFYDKYFEMREK